MLKNLRIRNKIIVLPSIAAFAFVLIIVVSLLLGKDNERRLTQIQTGYYPSLELGRDLEETLTGIQRGIRYGYTAGDMRALTDADLLRDQFLQRLEAGIRDSAIKPDEAEHLKLAMRDYFAFARKTAERLISGETGADLSPAMDSMNAKYNDISEELRADTERNKVEIAAAFRSTRNTQQATGIIITVITLMCLFLLVATSLYVVRAVTKGLSEAVRATDLLAGGDLAIKIQIDSTDETGQLLSAIKEMSHKLAQIIGEVRTAASILSSASVQVSASSQSLSQGTSEQAANVEEAVSSLEQMSASITQNAENSRHTEQMALSGAKDAEESGRVVKESVDAMRAIAEKISIIEEIAYQTNLLALNAAIEAARAGEHGRGFAVVASEVRKLAERSQSAAKQISGLASSTLKTSEHSGHLLADLVPAIRKTADLMQDVAAASSEQSSGVAQINRAMSQVDDVTQRNASAAEELASTAEEMSAQAQALQQLMSYFHLGEAEQNYPRPAGALPGPHRSVGPMPQAPGNFISPHTLPARVRAGMNGDGESQDTTFASVHNEHDFKRF